MDHKIAQQEQGYKNYKTQIKQDTISLYASTNTGITYKLEMIQKKYSNLIQWTHAPIILETESNSDYKHHSNGEQNMAKCYTKSTVTIVEYIY